MKTMKEDISKRNNREVVIMNVELKIALIRKFGSQVVGARRLEMCESKLSYLVRGHRQPSPEERQKLTRALGKDYFAVEEGPRAE